MGPPGRPAGRGHTDRHVRLHRRPQLRPGFPQPRDSGLTPPTRRLYAAPSRPTTSCPQAAERDGFASPSRNRSAERPETADNYRFHRPRPILAAATRQIDDPALEKLLLFNHELMDRFVDVALSQAKAAYVFRAAANKTFRMTAEQMSYYYGRPVVHCYLLHAEWPAERAAQHPDADRSLDRELIKATLQAAHDVQRHLLDLLEEKPGEAPASGASPNGVSSARTAP